MSRLVVRFGGFYAALFFVVGIQIPYWPLWLQNQGMDTSKIGILVATLLWVKVGFNPIAGYLVDITGRRRAILFSLTVCTLLSYIAFTFTSGFTSYLILSIIAGSAFAALMPIGDNLAMSYVIKHNMDYGRLRLWGSVAFIISSIGIGKLLEYTPSSLIVWLIIVALLPLCCTTLLLPDTRHSHKNKTDTLHWKDLLTEPTFWVFIGATAMTGASHAVYYGFATLHWRTIGIDTTWIGILWGAGVCAEVILFSFSRRVVYRYGVFTLITLGSVSGIIRWLALGYFTNPWVLLIAQCLHAFTFGALHLGAMHFIAQKFSPKISGRVQGLYAAMGNGVILGIVTYASAPIFEAYQGQAFYLMALCSCIGLLFAIWLPKIAHKRKGSRIFRESL